MEHEQHEQHKLHELHDLREEHEQHDLNKLHEDADDEVLRKREERVETKKQEKHARTKRLIEKLIELEELEKLGIQGDLGEFAEPEEEAGEEEDDEDDEGEDGSDAFPTFPPPPPEEIIAHRKKYARRIRPWVRWYWGHKEEDSSLKCLYRLYEYFVLDDEFWYRDELEQFWNQHHWPVCEIPDPKDDSPARYAFLACIPYLLVESFNEKIKIGQARDMPGILTLEQIKYYQTRPESTKVYEMVPEWAKRVSALPQTLVLPNHKGVRLNDLDDLEAEEAFKPKNILIRHPYIHFM
jgi:hypothetical protein